MSEKISCTIGEFPFHDHFFVVNSGTTIHEAVVKFAKISLYEKCSSKNVRLNGKVITNLEKPIEDGDVIQVIGRI